MNSDQSTSCGMLKVKVLFTQLYLTLWDTCQAPLSKEFSRQEYWTGLSFPSLEESSWSRDWTRVSHIAGGFFTSWATREFPRILEWVVYPFSRGSSLPRNWTWVSCIAGRFFTNWAIRESAVDLSIYLYIIYHQYIYIYILTIGEGNGTPLQYSCLENPMDGGAW